MTGAKAVARITGLSARSLAAPPSKSVTNRALVLAALAKGTSTLRRALGAEDTEAMARALSLLGASFSRPDPDTLEVKGTSGRPKSPGAPLDVGASGTALRFLTAIATLVPGRVVVTGQRRLCERPMADLVLALRRLGITATARGARGRPPIEIAGGEFPGGRVALRGRVSSQFISALLMVGPCGRTDLDLTIRHDPVSAPYIELTCDLMRRFGAEITSDGARHYVVAAGRPYGSRDLTIEGDASSASYFFALGAMLGQPVTVTSLAMAGRQGDLRFLDVLASMGCAVERHADGATVTGGELAGIEVDMADMPDVVPTLAVVALWARGVTRIRNVATLRVKESDRISALAQELVRVGAKVEELPDGLVIEPARARHGPPARIRTYDDHRIAMSFAVLGLARGGVSIENPSCVEKSYPGFWRDLEALAGKP